MNSHLLSNKVRANVVNALKLKSKKRKMESKIAKNDDNVADMLTEIAKLACYIGNIL